MNVVIIKCRFYQLVKTCILSLLFCSLGLNSYGNTHEIDSIKQALIEEFKDTDIKSIMDKAYDLHQENLELALVYSDICLEKAHALKDRQLIFYIYRDIGYYYENNNRLKEALSTYIQALEMAQKKDDDNLRLTAYIDLAIIHRKLGHYKKTKDYNLMAIDLAKEVGNKEFEDISYHGLGYLYETTGDYEKAIGMYLKSRKVAEEYGNMNGVITTMQNISVTYTKLNDQELAQQTIEEAYQLALKHPDSLQIANLLFDYGDILAQSGNYDEALEKLNASLETYKKSHNKSSIAKALVQIAEIYTEKGQYEYAQSLFYQSLTYGPYINSGDFSNLYYKFGQLHLKQDQEAQAEQALMKSLKIAKEQNLKTLIQKNNYGLYEIYKNQGNYEKALSYLMTSSETKDYLLNEDKSQRIAEMQFKFDSEKSEKEIQLLKLKQNRLLLIGFSGLFVFFVFFLIYIIRIKGKNNDTLTVKNEKIQEQNIKLKESNEVLKQFAYVAAHDLKEPLRNIGSFINLIQIKYGRQLNEEANGYMKAVKSGVKRLNGLLTDLLAYSQISAQPPGNEMTDIGEAIKVAAKNLRMEIRMSNTTIHCKENLPQICVSKQHLTQLLLQLIENAIKFCEKKPVIHIDCQKENKEYGILSISDNGIGIDKTYSDKIYQLFHRLDKNTHQEDTGIGLTICKNIVDKYNGEIWFESKKGEGTTFFVRLPFSNAATQKLFRNIEDVPALTLS